MKTQKRRSLIALVAVMALLLPALAGAYPAEAPRTGQTICYDTDGNVITCAGTGQDGDWLAGAPLPDPRFTDRGDGTVSDNLTGLVWAKNANLSNGAVNLNPEIKPLSIDNWISMLRWPTSRISVSNRSKCAGLTHFRFGWK